MQWLKKKRKLNYDYLHELYQEFATKGVVFLLECSLYV
jgi:hypothetical protein